MRTETARRVARVDRAARVLFALALAPTAGGLCAALGALAGDQPTPAGVALGAVWCALASALAAGARVRLAVPAALAPLALGATWFAAVLLPGACALVARASAALAGRAAKSA